LADAINRAQSTAPDKIRAALAATNLQAKDVILPWAGVKFDSAGQNLLTGAIFVQNQSGTPKLVWPNDQASAKLIWPRPTWR
ncbi:MAG: branched-chain amino acid ABC transporter substrate-binding protein, partial [Betaproteobacteria bacterium]|nr:branched-chain amino acid ABC transporter substrate-binding protein [Betaproteobacteria bacterium]